MNVDVTDWQAHVEVWLLILGVIGLGFTVQRIIGPKVTPAGESPTTPAQKRWFWSAVVLLWLASDWPMHDVSEEQLYLVHMIQHMLFTLIIPAMFLLAVPEWLARLLVEENGHTRRIVTWLTKPLVAGLQFALLGAFTHWSGLVNYSLESGPFHYGVHTLMVASAFLFWVPVCGPLHELRMSAPGQMVYLFLASLTPAIPGAWLAIAEGVVYSGYDVPERLWGISVTTDQQVAGLIMKLAGTAYLWVIITILFFRWSATSGDLDPSPRRIRAEAEAARTSSATDEDTMTWDQVEEALERAGPAPTERT